MSKLSKTNPDGSLSHSAAELLTPTQAGIGDVPGIVKTLVAGWGFAI